jgi:hypothetical protein
MVISGFIIPGKQVPTGTWFKPIVHWVGFETLLNKPKHSDVFWIHYQSFKPDAIKNWLEFGTRRYLFPGNDKAKNDHDIQQST